MKNFLTYLYEMELHENECNPPTLPSYKEGTIYDELQKELPEKQFKKLNDFIELYEARLAQACRWRSAGVTRHGVSLPCWGAY